jgi:hypothetical protein
VKQAVDVNQIVMWAHSMYGQAVSLPPLQLVKTFDFTIIRNVRVKTYLPNTLICALQHESPYMGAIRLLKAPALEARRHGLKAALPIKRHGRSKKE